MIRQKNPNGTIRWSDAEKEKLRDLYHEGYSDEEIAEELGRSPKAVLYKRYDLKLPKKGQPRKEFVIKGATSEYFPYWYKEKLKKEWQEKQSTSSR